MNISTRAFAALCAAFLFLGGCGGAETKTGSNGTGSTPASPEPAVASGALTGLGPLGLAGASLEDTTTQVLLNISTHPGTADLRLGMTANAIGTVAANSASGKATGAVAQSLVLGPVANVDANAAQLKVLSLTVQADQNTLLEGVTALSQIVAGDQVEVFGLALPTPQTALATRIIVRRPAASSNVELLGVITSNAPSSVVIQGINVNVTNALIGVTSSAGVLFGPAPIAAPLVPGLLVRVIGTVDASSGAINASSVASSLAPARAEGSVVFIENFVTERVSATRFKFADLDVDAGAGSTSAAALSAGSRVRVRGRMLAGVLRAEAVEIIPATARTAFAIEGALADYTSLSSFLVRGERIDASQAVFTQGSAANLANGKQVRLKGIAGPGNIVATEIAVAN